jgi:hypothetical protein
MNFPGFLKRLVLLITLLSVGNALPAGETDNTERIYQATFGVIAALGFKKQIDADPICRGKTYPDFDLNQFLDAIPKDFISDPGQREAIVKQFQGHLENLDTLQLPTGQTIPVAYQELKKGTALLLRKETESSDVADLCQKMYSNSESIFKTQIDSIQSLAVKK